MDLSNALASLVTSKPEYLLMVLAIILMPFVTLAAGLQNRWRTPGERRREFITTLLKTPALDARLKNPETDITDIKTILEQMLNYAAPPDIPSTTTHRGFWSKMSQDITWDVSGIIGLIVTIVLMFMVVSRTSNDMPREIIAGWTTILGFYFGKATK